MASTVAFGIRAPDLSTTVPTRSPLIACPNIQLELNSTSAARKIKNLLFIVSPCRDDTCHVVAMGDTRCKPPTSPGSRTRLCDDPTERRVRPPAKCFLLWKPIGLKTLARARSLDSCYETTE